MRYWLLLSLLLLPLSVFAETVTIEWDPPPPCTDAPCPHAAYKVYRRVDQGAPVVIASVLAQTQMWVDQTPQRGTNCYTIAAVNAAGKEGRPSSDACIFLPEPEPLLPNAPVNVRVRLGG